MSSFFLFLALICWTFTPSISEITPTDLTCEYLVNPSVVDVESPRLSWINKNFTNERGLTQSAYQIRVASSLEKLDKPDLWDSDKIDSDQSIRIEYAGKPLVSRQECWWQIRVWDGVGNSSDWSKPGTWRMGLLKPDDWKAEWIGAPWQGEEALPRTDKSPNQRPEEFGPPAPLMRKEFEIKKEIKKAVAFVTGLGYFEFYANGKKVGNDLLVPNQTNYGKRPNLPKAYINIADNFRKYKVMYLAYDIKPYLQQGKNVIGSILGNGFYNPAKFWTEGYGSPRFLGQIHITYTDGSEDVIISDESWKVAKGPILMDMVFYGEYYDARMEKPDWSTKSFDDSDWKSVVKRKAPEGELVAHTANPDKVTERIKPVSIEKLENGNYKVDFGVEISGWVRLNNVEGPAGHKVEIAFNGNLYSGDNTYTFKGGGAESYAPRFNWFVFSGVEIKNWPGELKPEHLTAEAVNTYIEESAKFETSSKLFNDINKIWRRSQVDNMHGGIASDCPHRERSAYTGDGQVACLTVMHNYDARNFYQKWIHDIFETQNIETGYVPNGAPWQPGCGGGIAWGAAICIMPWHFYSQYGTVDILEDNYEGMKDYIRYMETWKDNDGIIFSQRKNGSGEILKWFNLGEWVLPGEKLAEELPDHLVHTFYFWKCADFTSRAAKSLNRIEDANYYAQLAEKTKTAFHRKYYNAESGTYGKWGGNIFALKMGVPTDQYKKVTDALRADIEANDGHLDTGIFGTRFFFEVLSENGMHDLAFAAINKNTYPSYGHWLELGATTTREQWEEEGSYNHPMFGGGLVWFYRNLAGMKTDSSIPGYKHIIFKPQPLEQLGYVTYVNKTVYGEAGITWTNKADKFTMDVIVPVGSTASIYVPATDENEITEGGKNIDKNKWVEFLRAEEHYTVFHVKSGSYSFEAKR